MIRYPVQDLPPLRQQLAGLRPLAVTLLAATLLPVAIAGTTPLALGTDWSRLQQVGGYIPAFSTEPTLINQSARLDSVDTVTLGGWRLSLRHQNLDHFANPFDVYDPAGELVPLNPLRWQDERFDGDNDRWGLYDYHGVEGERWALFGMAGVEWREESDSSLTAPSFSLGIRPMIKLGSGWRMVGEMGYDYPVESYFDQPQRLYRMTLAAEWLGGTGLNDSSMRAFVTQRGEDKGWHTLLPNGQDEWQAGVEWQTRW
jgi:hypothetical protein